MWLPGAIADLQRLREFLRSLDSDAAKKAVTAIKGAVKLLVHHPYLGKPAEDLPDHRDIVIPFGAAGYLMRYRIQEDTLFIVAVKHTKEAGFTGTQKRLSPP